MVGFAGPEGRHRELSGLRTGPMQEATCWPSTTAASVFALVVDSQPFQELPLLLCWLCLALGALLTWAQAPVPVVGVLIPPLPTPCSQELASSLVRTSASCSSALHRPLAEKPLLLPATFPTHDCHMAPHLRAHISGLSPII